MYTSLIGAEELSQHLQKNWVIVDCRFSLFDKEKGRKDFAKAHIPGAVYAHLDQDLSGPIIPVKTGRHPLPTPETFVKLLSSWGINADKQVIVYDNRSGAIASRLWWMLRWLGHDKVAVLDGGWKEWQDGEYPISDQPSTPTPETFIPNVQTQMAVDANRVNEIRQQDEFRLFDSRAAKRYQGLEEPIDPIAGHIPGALSLPFMDNVGEDGRLLPKEALQKRFKSQTNGISPNNTVFYCGSGVTACHNILAFYHAGLGNAVLYPGSWSEWIIDPSRERA